MAGNPLRSDVTKWKPTPFGGHIPDPLVWAANRRAPTASPFCAKVDAIGEPPEWLSGYVLSEGRKRVSFAVESGLAAFRLQLPKADRRLIPGESFWCPSDARLTSRGTPESKRH